MSIKVCSNPVFVIGSPRSGTSILAWSLAQHTQLWTSSELYLLDYLFGDRKIDAALRRNDTEKQWCWLREQNVSAGEFLKYLGLGIDALMTSRSQGKRWVDQTPVHTLMADTLAEMFPDAFFLHILRDGRRVVNSLVNWNQPNLTGDDATWKLDFKSASGLWKTYVEAALDFCIRYPNRSLTVINEKLATNPSGEFNEIFKRLALPYEEPPINYLQSNVVNSSFQSPTHVPHKVEPWKEWTVGQKDIFLRETGSAVEQYRLVQDDWYSLRKAPIYRAGNDVQR